MTGLYFDREDSDAAAEARAERRQEREDERRNETPPAPPRPRTPPAPFSGDERYWHPERDRQSRRRPDRYAVVGPAGETLCATLAVVRRNVNPRDLILDRRTGRYVGLDGRPLDPQPDGAPNRRRKK